MKLLSMKRLFAHLLIFSMILTSVYFGSASNSFASGGYEFPTHSGDRYVTPTGAGLKDGTDWNNAFEGDKSTGLQSAWNSLVDGAALYVGSGTYVTPQTLNLSSGGTSLMSPKRLVGKDTGGGSPVFIGDWSLTNQNSRKFIDVSSGASYWWIQDIKIQNYSAGIYARGKHVGVRIYNVDVHEMSDGFYFNGGATALEPDVGSNDIIIEGSDFTNYTKRGARFRDGNYNVRVISSTADAGGQSHWISGNFPMGFQVADSNQNENVWEHGIVFIDVVSQNNWHEAGSTGYWNGDGFTAERQAYDIVYIRCKAFNNTDGGFDDKSKNPTVVDSVAFGNKRNFRFWSSETAVLIRSVGGYAKVYGGIGDAAGLWVGGTTGNIEMHNSTLHNNDDHQVFAEGGTIRVFDSIVSTTDSNVPLYTEKPDGFSKIEAYNTHEYIAGVQGTNPQYIQGTNAAWNGEGNDFNSTVYGTTKGYHYRGQEDSGSPGSDMITSAVSTGYVFPAHSGDLYVTPNGAGQQDGSDWSNAMAGNSTSGLQAAWDNIVSGSTLYIGSGIYDVPQTLTISSGGAGVMTPKRIAGVDTGSGLPKFIGAWSLDNRNSQNFIYSPSDVDNIWIQDISIHNYIRGVFFKNKHKGIRIYNVDVTDMQDGLMFEGTNVTGAVASSDIIIKDSDMKNYRLRGVRFRYGNTNGRIISSTADGGGQDNWYTGNFPIGFSVAHNNNDVDLYDTGFVFVDVSSGNNYHENGTNYWNADSFTSERKSGNLVYVRAKAYDNTDGGWDEKATNTTLVDTVAVRSKRNYRFWSASAVMVNAVAANAIKRGGSGGAHALWSRGHVETYNSTFHNNGNTQVTTDSGEIQLFDTIISTTNSSGDLFSGSNIQRYLTHEYIAGVTGSDPQYVNGTNTDWYGEGKDFDNNLYGAAKGYRYIGPVNAFTPGSTSIMVNKTASSITVDGSLNESVWDASTVASKAVIGAPNNQVEFGALWDDTYLYVGITVSDSNLMSDSGLDIWEDDSVEIYIDADHNHGLTYDGFDRQFQKGWNNTTLRERYGNTTGVLHDWSAITGGYSIELAIPWSNLGVTPIANMTIGFDVGNNDDDDGGARDSQLVWEGTGDNWKNTSSFGHVTLSSNTVGVPDTTAPAAPTNLVARIADSDQIDLDWADNTESDLASYNIYRDTVSGFTPSSSNKVASGIPSSSYADTVLSTSTIYYYKVTAVDLSDNESTSSSTASSAVTTAYKTLSSISIDGSLSEGAWDMATSASKTISGTPNDTVKFGVLWDANYLYVAATVTDSSLIDDSGLDIWDDDSVEIYIDADHNHSITYDSFDRQFQKGWNNTTLRERYGNTSGVLHGWSAVTGGYSIELAIPWSNLGVTPADNMTIGFDVGNNDDDDGGLRDSQTMWIGTGDNWKNTSDFGDLILSPITVSN